MRLFIAIISLLLRITFLINPIDFSEKNWPDACIKGLRNSPIDFPPLGSSSYMETKSYIKILSNSYKIFQGQSFKFDNEWRFAIHVSEMGGLMIEKLGVVYKYDLIQIHFHLMSEHTFQGSSYDLEVHMLHMKDSKYLVDQGVQVDPDLENNILVTAIIFKASGNELNLDISKMNIETGAPINNLDLSPYVSPNKSFFHYIGSRTAPPCEQTVNWIVFEKIENMSNSQYDDFKNWVFPIFPLGNTRLPKPLFGRTIYHYTAESNYVTLSKILTLIVFLILFIL